MPTTITNSPAIIIRDTTLAFNDNIIFSDLNVIIKAANFTCLLGPSGIGKSSLLRLVTDLIDKKTATVKGEIYCSNDVPLTNNIAYLAQSDSLLPWLTTLKNVLLSARLRNKVTLEKKQLAIELLEKVGLTKVTHVLPDKLSGGMRQRTALVRTLLEDKPIILMDEPFSALDVITRLQLQDLAAELLKDKTVLLVTHDPLEALRLGHTIYVMSGQPATLSEPIVLDSAIPRATTDATILQLQGKLLQQLETAKAAA